MNNSCILGLNSGDLINGIKVIGTNHGLTYDESKKRLISLSNHQELNVEEATYNFLLSNDYLENKTSLNNKGKKMFEYLFIINQKDQFIKMIKTDLYSNPIVNLIYQVFYGKGRIIKERMLNLLQLNNIDNDITDKEVTKLLTLLNKYNIVKYNNKNNYFIVIESDQLQPQINGAYIEPSLPFSNIYNMRKVLRGCTGDIYWIDKHFRKEGLEIICDSFLTSGVNSITIISSDENKTQTAIADFKNLEIELNSRGIKIEWLIIEDKNFKWHDRWIISQNCYYNIPPVLAIVRGQRSEIIKTNNMVDLPNFLKNTAYKVT